MPDYDWNDDAFLAAIHQEHENGESWEVLGDRYDVSSETLRKRVYRWRDDNLESEPPIPDMSSDGLHVHRDEDGNYMSVSAESKRIKTLDDMIEACEIDLDVWQIERVRYNKWEVGAKSERKNIKWTDGTIVEGFIRSDGGLVVEPLFQVRVDCVRREPLALFPCIQPVQAKTKYVAQQVQKEGGLLRSFLFADPHFGFRRDRFSGDLVPMHDRGVLDLALQIIHDSKPDRIDCLGDVLDLAEWSDRFIRSPDVRETTQPSIEEAHWWLAQMRHTAKRAQFKVHEGNHDRRMQTAIITHLLAAHDLHKATDIKKPAVLSVPGLLDLQALGIGWVGKYPNDEDWLTDTLVLQHGDVAQGSPGNTARKVASESDVTRIYAHVHRWETVPRVRWTRYGPIPLSAMSIGCCCRLDEWGPPSRTDRNQWQQGFAVLDYDPEGGDLLAVTPVYVLNGQCIWNGKLYTARDRIGELAEAMDPWRVA